MKPEDHIKRYKQMRITIKELLNKPFQERDKASIVTIAHWSSYHLVSAIIDQLPIVEQLKHHNHRGVKKTLKNPQVQALIGDYANEILYLYNFLETNFLTKFQYGGIESTPDYENLKQILEKLETICKNITEELQESHGN